MLREEIGRAEAPPRTRGALVVALLLGLVAGCAALAFLFKTSVPAFDQPDQRWQVATYVSATALCAAILSWLVLWFAVVRRRAPWRGFAYFLVLVLALTAGEAGLTGLVVYGKRMEQARAEADIAETKAAIDDISTVILSADQGGRFYVADRSQLPGEAGVIGGITKQYMHALNVNTGRESAKANRFFNAGNYYKPHRLGQADVDYLRQTVATARAAIAEYWKQRAVDLAAYRTDLAAAQLSAKTKAAALTAFDDAARRGEPGRASFEALDESLILKSETIVRDMQRLVTLESRNSTVVDLYDASNNLNAAIRDGNSVVAARNRRVEYGMQS